MSDLPIIIIWGDYIDETKINENRKDFIKTINFGKINRENKYTEVLTDFANSIPNYVVFINCFTLDTDIAVGILSSLHCIRDVMIRFSKESKYIVMTSWMIRESKIVKEKWKETLERNQYKEVFTKDRIRWFHAIRNNDIFPDLTLNMLFPYSLHNSLEMVSIVGCLKSTTQDNEFITDLCGKDTSFLNVIEIVKYIAPKGVISSDQIKNDDKIYIEEDKFVYKL